MTGRIALQTAVATVPYVAWMALMALLPAGAKTYALRSAATLSVLAVLLAAELRRRKKFPVLTARGAAVGILAGLAVFALWVLPENFEFYRKFLIIGGTAGGGDAPFDPAKCGWPLTLARLAGSAFVIAPAEELFFRHFLYRRLQNKDWTAVDRRKFDMQAFLWCTALFALEHDRIAAGAAAGAVYALVYIRKGVFSAVLAHTVTNFILGVYVIKTAKWAFW